MLEILLNLLHIDYENDKTCTSEIVCLKYDVNIHFFFISKANQGINSS